MLKLCTVNMCLFKFCFGYFLELSYSRCVSQFLEISFQLRIHSAIASWIHRYFDNVMTKSVINSGTDARRTDLNLLTRLFTHHTVPARTPETTVFILSMSLVNTDAAKPYMVLLALSISSSMSLNFIICITGPKIYYRKT